eukprot:1606319-Pyramimonas_sp.AAC.1
MCIRDSTHAHTCGPIGVSTEGTSGGVQRRRRHPCRHAPHTLRSPAGGSTDCPSSAFDMRPRHP